MALIGGLIGINLVGASLVLGVPHLGTTGHGGQTILAEGTTVLNATPVLGVAVIVNFTVAPPGGELTGQVDVTNLVGWLGAGQAGVYPPCPKIGAYYSGPKNLTQNLTPGEYTFGIVCGGVAKLVVTQEIEVTYP